MKLVHSRQTPRNREDTHFAKSKHFALRMHSELAGRLLSYKRRGTGTRFASLGASDEAEAMEPSQRFHAYTGG